MQSSSLSGKSSSVIRSQHIIVMGVCACGKSTIGSILAEKLNWTFFDGDDFHSSENIAKMRKGIPLDDEDRKAWLESQQQHLINLSKRNVSSILACSALKVSYRAKLAEPFYTNKALASSISFLWLAIDQCQVRKRMRARKNHFMNLKLIESQFNTLEEPSVDKEGLQIYTVQASYAIAQVVALSLDLLHS